MLQTELLPRLELALAAAEEAGAITLEFFRRGNYQVELKPDQTPVTVADRKAEQRLRERIEGRFKSDAILGEELPSRDGTSGFRWILDPIDGTKSFVSGVPLYGTLIGVEFDGQSVIGVINLPALGESVYAAAGQGAWCARDGMETRQARVSDKTSLADALFCTSELAAYDGPGRRPALAQLESACRLARTWGDCYGYVLVATGRAELMLDPVVNLWDCAAIQPILEEAGGTFTDWQGHRTMHAGEAVATNGHVLDQVLAITRAYPRP
ncbi:MAG: histidinol-phosphatase [Pirellulales bacterium]